MAAGIAGVRLLTVVRVSSSSDRCLIVSHQVCKVVTFNRKKLTMVERCRSNHCVNNSINVFRLMQERKYVCGEQLKIRILQQKGTAYSPPPKQGRFALGARLFKLPPCPRG